MSVNWVYGYGVYGMRRVRWWQALQAVGSILPLDAHAHVIYVLQCSPTLAGFRKYVHKTGQDWTATFQIEVSSQKCKHFLQSDSI